MRKILYISLLFCFCMTATANADIRRRIDFFDESIKVRSVRQSIGSFAQFNFVKIIETSGNIYFQLYASTHFMKKNDYAKDYAEVKINKKIFKVNVIKIVGYKDTDDGILSISSTIDIPSEAIEPLRSAEKVTLRFHRENGYEDVVELPDNVLEEWKQVINTEE